MIRKVLLASTVAIVVALGVPTGGPAQVPAGCSVPVYGGPVVCPPPPACATFTSKLSLARATISRLNNTISILAPITSLASGSASVQLHAAGIRTTFGAPIDSVNARIRVIRTVTRSQALLGTGILTFNYPGDADTRPQVVRLRAAPNPARLRATRPTISPTGRLEADGVVTISAQGVVRTQLEFVSRATGVTTTLQFNAPIVNGRYSLSVQLSPAVLAQIGARCGTVHSYTQFTGYIQRRIRGEIRSFQVLGPL